MLLNSRISSIPCSPRQSVPYIRSVYHGNKKATQNTLFPFASQSPTGLQYFNMRVTQRLRRYRSMKKQWHEVATSVQNTPVSPRCESPTSFPESLPITKNQTNSSQKPIIESKTYCINDYINSTTATKDNNEKNLFEFDPLHSRIQQDLIKLRKLIKTKRKFYDNTPRKTPTSSRPSGEATSVSATIDDQENNTTIIRKTSSFNKLKPLDRVKIAGCQMRPPQLPKSESTDSGPGSTSNSSSTCSQYSKQQQQQQQKTKRQNNNKTFNIYHSRVNPPPPPLPSDSFIYRGCYSSKKKSSTLFKMTQSAFSKQSLSSSLQAPIPLPQTPSVLKKKQPSFIKQETPLPPIQRLSDSGDRTTTPLYTYSAASSAATPHSMLLKRNTSLLPILLQSSSCIGLQPRETRPKKPKSDSEEDQQENTTANNDDDDDEDGGDDNYYHLLDYKHLINRLPKPIISIFPRYGQDDYGVLFEQLNHIRDEMPDSNIYDDYARII